MGTTRTFRSAVEWRGDHLELIDQTLLPSEEEVREVRSVADAVDAIARLVVRGAPAIGVCGAFGVALGVREARPADLEAALRALEASAVRLESARPTAVNLGWAVHRVAAAARTARSAEEVFERALGEARAIQEEDRESCRAIGENGRRELAAAGALLTHCNTGRLATAGWGTALGVVYAKAEAGDPVEVFVSETRPLLQGARLTAWELLDAGIPATLVTDGMSAALMASGRVQAVIVGCDRVARNGDTANKIGTFTHAIVARAHGIPFYVAGPLSSFDPDAASGDRIVVEERPPEEVLQIRGVPVAAPIPVWNPAFDVTPAGYVTAFITDRGVLRPPFELSITGALAKAGRS